MLYNESKRNKTLQTIEKDLSGPSLNFKKAMLEPFLKMLEDTANKLKNEKALELFKQKRERSMRQN